MAKLSKTDLYKIDTKTGVLKYWWPFIEMIENGDPFKLGAQGNDGSIIIASNNKANTKRMTDSMRKCITTQMVRNWLDRKGHVLPKQGGGNVKITDLWKENVKPMPTNTSTKIGGRDTEVYSEVLAQFCLAYCILNGTAATVAATLDIDGEKVSFKPDVFRSCKKMMITPSAFNLNSTIFVNKLAQFASQPLGTSGEESREYWVDAQGKAMAEVQKRYKFNNQVRIYNDKIFGGSTFAANPYYVYMQAKKNQPLPGEDKWNPADMWVMTNDGVRNQVHMNRTVKSMNKVGIETANNFLLQQYKSGNIVPISLKKPSSNPHVVVMNSDEYFDRIVLGATSNPTVEYTFADSKGNSDVKINFTVETVQISSMGKPRGNSLRQMLSARMRGQSTMGTVISRKHIRIKYHVNNKKIELEYTQSEQPSLARAKMGSLGYKNFTSVINSTTTQGVHELNKIQEKYSDIGVKKSPWFNAQLKESINNQQYDRLVQYVGEIWKYITKDNAPDFSKIQAVNNATGLASKAMAGEFGMSIAGIKSDAVQRRVITHLYEACASIAFGSGLNKDELELLQATGGSGVSRRSKFNSSIHVKVY
jgi:hypothetical protein